MKHLVEKHQGCKRETSPSDPRGGGWAAEGITETSGAMTRVRGLHGNTHVIRLYYDDVTCRSCSASWGVQHSRPVSPRPLGAPRADVRRCLFLRLMQERFEGFPTPSPRGLQRGRGFPPF